MSRVSESLQEYAERTNQPVSVAYADWHMVTLADGRHCLGLLPEDVKDIAKAAARGYY